MDYAALKSEISTDPLALGYAPYVTAMSDAVIANMLNAQTGAGIATITLPTLTYAEMLTGLMPALIAIASATTAIQGKYDRVLSAIKTLPVIQYAVAAPILASLVTDGLETQAAITAFTTDRKSVV